MKTCYITGSIVLCSHFNRALLCCAVWQEAALCECVYSMCVCGRTLPPVWFAVPHNATEGSVTLLIHYRGQIKGQMKYQQDHMTTDYHEGFNRTEGSSSTLLYVHARYMPLLSVCVRAWDGVTEWGYMRLILYSRIVGSLGLQNKLTLLTLINLRPLSLSLFLSLAQYTS